MKQYETYKETSSKFIKNIPSHWKKLKVKYLVDRNTYYPVGDGDHGSIKPSMYQTNGIPYIRVQNLSWDGKIDISNAVYISEEIQKANKKSNLFPGDILIAKTGATIGKLGLISEEIKEANTTSSVGKLTVDLKFFNPKYILYCFQSKNFNDQMWLEASQKSAQPGFNIDDLIEFELAIPKRTEQTQIAAYLDYKTGLIDAIIAQKEALIKKLKEQRQAIINEAVTKGLNKNVKLKDSGIEWLGDIPQHWVISKFKYFATIRNGKDQKGVLVENGKYPILGTGGEFGRASEFLYDKPSVLLGRKGTIDKPQFIEEPFWTVDTLFYTEIHEDVSPKYLFYLSTLIPFNLLQESSAVPSMTQDKLHNVFLTKPIKEEQNKIVKHIENEMNKMDLLISKAKESIQKLKEYRQSLISEAVTGKVDVRDWQAPKS